MVPQRLLAFLFALLALASPLFAQSQAANGGIEGTITDESSAVLPGVTVTVRNLDTGAERVVVTNADGVYRALLIPLGAYRVTAELAGFKKYEQTGITVGAGQTAVINIALGVGDVSEVISVTADTPLVDPGKIDLGRTLNEREIKNLPLVSRNPYNFALLQPGVTGFENQEFGVPRFSANGTLLRINYQIDGNTNTQKDRAGLRLLPVSEVMVREVKVVTSGYAPEFGQTTGLVYNAITPSGTNQFRGSASYRFRRKDFAAFPFFFQGPRTDDRKPETKTDTYTAELGGPVVRDRLHFFGGFESTARDLSSQRVITIAPENAAALGLSAQPPIFPTEQTARFYIGKGDWTIAPAHRLTARYIGFRNDSPNNPNNFTGLTSTDLAVDFLDAMDSTSAQLVSTFGNNRVNELRVQYAHRHQSRARNELSGSGPSILVSGVAAFGGPYANTSEDGFDFTQGIFQVVNNFTLLRANHSYKFGFDIQHVADTRTSALQFLYTFPSIQAYNDARSGVNPRSYTNVQQLLGDPNFEMSSNLYSFFVQDDWRLTKDLKVLYGIRYDLYDYPTADPASPFAYSQDYPIDKNNWGPRVGVSWALDQKTVLRASTGVMFDQPLLAIFENAIQQNGLPVRFTANVAPTAANAPNFPNPVSTASPPRQSIFTADPDFVTARTFQNNVQIDRQLGQDFAAQVGFVYVKGSNLPVVTNINPINPIRVLADGRPVFSTEVTAATRLDPRFNQINVAQSIGDSDYAALTLNLSKRFTKGYQFDLTYTYGKGEDNAPITSALAVQGDDGRSDPTDLDRDEGPNVLDQRHSFAGSFVATPEWQGDNALLRALLNNNQVGILLQFNSGLPFNVRSNLDLNNDGIAADRPLFVGRNSYYLPARYNTDVRYSRFFPISGRYRAELVAEFKNLFNTVQTSAVNRVVTTNAAGEPATALPAEADGFVPTAGYEQRQFQLGFKFSF
jgi:hypothetical protein